MADRFTVTTAGPLLAMLAQHFTTWSKNTLRERLRLGCIDVNGAVATRHDQQVAVGDVVEIRAKGDAREAQRGRAPFVVLFEDDDLLAIDKPAGLLSVSTDDETARTALALARERFRIAALWPAHRLDRETSGVLLLTKSRETNERVQANWQSTRKVYVAVVEGEPRPAAATIDVPLREDAGLRVRAGVHPDARPATTRYRTIATRRGLSLLEVEIETGRKHQIRVHLASIGHPVVGDDRYGTRGPRLMLHAARLELPHPRDGRSLVIEAPVPPVLRDAVSRGT